MIRPFAVILTLSLTLGAAAPVLCELDCLSHASRGHSSQHCHDKTPGPTLSAARGLCDHTLADFNASVLAAKVANSEELRSTPPVGTLTISTPSLDLDHASGPPDRISQPRSVLRTVLRI